MAKEESTGTGVVLEASRREKMRKIIEMGLDPWGQRFDNHDSIEAIRARENEIVVGEPVPVPETPDGQKPWRKPEIPMSGPQVRAAGRIILQRRQGKLIFLTLWDWTGQIQILIGKNQVGEKNWELALCFDLGDIIGVDGEFKKTQKGELTIFASDLTFLSKSIETPPDKFKGLSDPELRSRMRYMDLVHTDGVMQRMLNRTKIISSIRNTLAGEGFVEVEGPTLHAVAGGAAARPFITHHNALDIPLYMRIALELHLKRLLVGGMERVYEIGRVYRNEGIDQTHNPEFTMMELYQSYGDYHSMMDITEKIIVEAIKATGQGFVLPWGDKTIDFTPPFARKSYFELFQEHTGVDPRDETAVRAYAKTLGIEDVDVKHPDVVRNEIFEAKVEDALIGPVFVTDYPANICPLTKRKQSDPTIAERFELFIHGMELANAYTELNDPDLQEELFRKQLAGQKEEDSMAKMDNDFIRALRHGMPPAGGLGMGVDRLIMILTNTTSIRDVILFPLLRP
ncbi:MAG: lysine--tRNA ligase, partial [Thermoguttaceae bacterium]|nr:lysine--tRNA ligase [Thermoguttaceae bacterium]